MQNIVWTLETINDNFSLFSKEEFDSEMRKVFSLFDYVNRISFSKKEILDNLYLKIIETPLTCFAGKDYWSLKNEYENSNENFELYKFMFFLLKEASDELYDWKNLIKECEWEDIVEIASISELNNCKYDLDKSHRKINAKYEMIRNKYIRKYKSTIDNNNIPRIVFINNLDSEPIIIDESMVDTFHKEFLIKRLYTTKNEVITYYNASREEKLNFIRKMIELYNKNNNGIYFKWFMNLEDYKKLSDLTLGSNFEEMSKKARDFANIDNPSWRGENGNWSLD